MTAIALSLESPLDDASLVARAGAADVSAQRVLYARHARYIAGVVYRLMGNDGDLEDIVQETFISAFEGMASVEDPSAVRAWLVTIAVRRVRRLLSQRRRRRFFFFSLAETLPQRSDPRDREPVDDLAEAVRQLPCELRIPWVLARVEQVTLPETARICEISLATVKRRLVDADARIERRLA